MIDQQARDELVYEWQAEYSDGVFLDQYDDVNQKEHHFGHIDLARLQRFSLIRKDSPDVFAVDINTGNFFHNNQPIDDLTFNLDERVKLIYFRRVQRYWGPGVKPGQEQSIEYHLGWESSSKDKKVICIREDSSFYIEKDKLNSDGFSAL